MRIITNEGLIRRNKRLAQYLFFGTFGVLILSLFVINQPGDTLDPTEYLILTLLQGLMLPLAFGATMLSVRMTNLWVRQPRPEDILRESLKGISTRSHLYNYFHFPARHVLICPHGVFAIVTRFQEGKFSVQGSQWRSYQNPFARFLTILRFEGVGSPTADALRAAAHVKKLLEPIAPDVPIYPLILFTNPRAVVDVTDDPVVKVIAPGENGKFTIKEVLRDFGTLKTDPLTPEQVGQLDAATFSAEQIMEA